MLNPKMQTICDLELPILRVAPVARRTGRKTLFFAQKYQNCPKFIEIWAGASSLSVMVGQGFPQPISRVDHALFSSFAFFMPSWCMQFNGGNDYLVHMMFQCLSP